ncbi:MAG: DegV family protein [Anaerolineae bacterium]|jgi:DegV family protein with EDD domain
MSRVRIVTDSAADLMPAIAQELEITIVPSRVQVGDRIWVDGPELRTPSFYRRVFAAASAPKILPPTGQQFMDAYAQLAPKSDTILSIHTSGALDGAVQAARYARGYLGRRYDVRVIDSQFASVALGMLVTAAAKAAHEGAPATDVEKLLRGLIPHTYCAFYVDSPERLERAGVMVEGCVGRKWDAQQCPLLLLEDGNVTLLPRRKRKGTAVERLAEFAGEFVRLRHLTMVHTGVEGQPDALRELLKGILPKQAVEEQICGPSFGRLVGPAGMALVAAEL